MIKRVSELITVEHLKNLKVGDVLTITAGTGTGKSYFIKNNLYAFAKKENKKILLLVHRDNCRNQFFEEILKDKKIDTVVIKTYQYLEAHKDFDFEEFKYIVADEFHYFISDAAFNPNTDISLDMIMKSNTIKIFMSATGNLVKRHINKYYCKTIDFEMPIDYSWIYNIFWFNKEKTIKDLCNECVKKNMKTIVFIDNAEKCYNLYKEFKEHSLFNCSKSNKLYKYVDPETINDMLKNEKFNCNILFTTTCLDAGVNIIDDELKAIILDVYDFDTFKQCIGRKRRKPNEQVELYVQTQNNNKIGAKLRLDRIAYDMVITYEKDYDEFIEKYSRSTDNYVNKLYNCLIRDTKINNNNRKEVNKLMMSKILENGVDSELMIGYEVNGKTISGVGYRNMLLRKLGFETDEYDRWEIGVDLEEENNKVNLKEYLESIIGKKLYKEEQKELKEVFKENGLKARTLGINTLNGNLKDTNMPYIIDDPEHKPYRDENGKLKRDKTYWIVGKIVY